MINHKYYIMGVLFPKISDETRTIHFQNNNENSPNNSFSGNKINTSKYNLLTFMPKSLLLQFTRLSNIVFLANVILQTIPAISTISPLTAIGPLAFVLGLSMLREGYQDYKRHRKDQQVNSRKTNVIRNSSIIETEWQQIKPGQIIRLECDQIIPADCLLLYSSHEGGLCYVQTANLDGQNNLKEKYVNNQIYKSGVNKMQNLKGFLTIDKPTPDLYSFSGKVELEGKQPIYIDFSNLLLRETVLKNTNYVICMSLYCGHDSKILRNQGVIHHKISNIQKKTNRIQIGLVIILILLCSAASAGYHKVHSIFNLRHESSYIPNITQLPLIGESFIMFFTIFLLLNFLIPITFNILIEGIKTFSALFLSLDMKMYDPQSKRSCGILNSSILQQLGVIDCVLTDKTGTLTANQMVFKAVAIKDKVYTRDFITSNIDILSQNEDFYDFMVGVIICHDVVRDDIKDQYQGSSPDEVCFINFANSIGFRFIGKTNRLIQIQIFGQIIKFQLLDMIAFSPRKRMSVVVRQKDNKNRVIVYTKGADSTIYSKANWYAQSQIFKENIDIFAKDGLRTLVFSKKIITLKEFKHYISSKQQSKRYFQQRLISKVQFESKQAQLIERMQQNLQITGATGIQDRLQQRVPQTIQRLQLASIMVMMITGDKLQTAENIGYLSYLIKQNYKVFKISHEVESAYNYLKSIITEVSQSKPFTLIIEGRHITQMMEQDSVNIIKLYITFFKKAKTIIFCRSSPKEKAIIVKFVKQRMNLTVLAIGDGGNDVGMIQQAHVGVGIVGKQGNTAAAVSDFSIARFHFLDRLILHHGRWFDYRLSYFFVFFGLKNMTITLILFFYLIDSAYSGNMIISEIYYALYNAFIAISLMVYFGLYEQDINDDLEPEAYRYLPQFYSQSKQLQRFSYKDYISWSLMAIVLAALIYYFAKVSLCMQINEINGRPSGFLFFRFCIGFILNIIIIVLNYEDIKTRTWFFQVAIFGLLSIAPTVSYFIVESQLQFLNMYQVLWENLNYRFMCTSFLIISIVYMFKKGFGCFQVQYYPTAIDLFKKIKHQSQSNFQAQIFKVLKRHKITRKKSKKQKIYSQLVDEQTTRKRRKRLLSIANITISEMIQDNIKHKSARVHMTEDYMENQTE